ncbi:hypothetical protein HY971_05010 [Candidatus Kaiserbacteria bacterium]|nr:hypothetical protein [Candidatus Kaiserbacteria bacterium]
MRTEIKSGGEVFAVVLDLESIQEGTFPATDPAWSIQLLLMKRKSGHVVAKHTHKKITKTTQQPQEAIVVIKGAIEASIFDEKGELIENKRVTEGQCLLIIRGGHEVRVIEDALMYAFKDGPFVDDKIAL